MALNNLATSYFDQRNYQKALPYLEELVKVDRDEIALMLLGICYQNQGRSEEALSLFERAVQAAPQSADLRRYLGSVYQRMGRTDDATRQLKLAELLSRKVPQPQ